MCIGGVKVDSTNNRLIWKPEELEENIFRLVETIQRMLDVIVIDEPFKDGEYWCWRYRNRRRL